MGNDLIREKIILDQRAGHEKTQILLEGDIIVPDIKPDIAIILQTDAKVCIDRTEVSADRVNFMGRLDIQVLYLARGSEKPVHSMSITANIDDFVNIDGANVDMWVEVKPELTNIDYRVLNDRKINYRGVVDIEIIVEATNTHEIVVNIEDTPSNQLLKTTLNVNRSIENKADRFIVKDEVPIPSGKPNIRELLQCSVNVSNKEIRIGNGKITIAGELALNTLYKGESESSLIEFVENEIPFNGNLDIAGATEDMMGEVFLTVQDQYVQVRPDNDGEERLLELEISIGVVAKVHTQDNLEILEDAYCINKELDITKVPIRYPKLICRNKNQAPIKEIVTIGESNPDILQILHVKGKAFVEDVKVIEDKVVAEGFIETDILYVAESDSTPLYAHKTILPYRQVIETKGAMPHMNAVMHTSIDHIGFNMLSGRELEVRFLLSFATKVVDEQEMNMITDIQLRDMDRTVLDNMASMTVYVVQNGDNLWNIAKQYNTSMDDLLSLNDMAEHKIIPGQKLLILKKIG